MSAGSLLKTPVEDPVEYTSPRLIQSSVAEITLDHDKRVVVEHFFDSQDPPYSGAM